MVAEMRSAHPGHSSKSISTRYVHPSAKAQARKIAMRDTKQREQNMAIPKQLENK